LTSSGIASKSLAVACYHSTNYTLSIAFNRTFQLTSRTVQVPFYPRPLSTPPAYHHVHCSIHPIRFPRCPNEDSRPICLGSLYHPQQRPGGRCPQDLKKTPACIPSSLEGHVRVRMLTTPASREGKVQESVRKTGRQRAAQGDRPRMEREARSEIPFDARRHRALADVDSLSRRPTSRLTSLRPRESPARSCKTKPLNVRRLGMMSQTDADCSEVHEHHGQK
jgi:hypothetical protein